VDHYAIAAPWEQALRQAHQQRHGKPVRILAIDDLADRAHDCDILLDQNQQQEGRYAHLLPPYCTALLGPRHALVRPEFARLRQQAAAAPSDGVLIYFGTTSLGSLVLDALQAFDHTAPRGLTAHVLAPPGAHVPPALDAAVLKLGKARCRLHLGTDDMAGLMGRCRLAIGAAGTTSWERCTLGLPSVLVSVADNQEPGARALAAAGAAMYLGRAQDVTRATLEHALGALFDQPLLFEGMHSTAAALCDGKGAAQVMAAMEASNISMRRATLHDAPMLHAWRNSEAVRSASFDSRHLPLDEHTGWMQKVLADPMRFLLVAQAHGQDCGCVRFDQNGDSATVSVYLAPDWLHRGIGSAVISAASQWAFDQVPGLRGIDAAIIPTNQASRQAFERAGYQLSRQVYRRNRGDAGLAG
jgi:UDP-2,4-diacetamido-2,4,6-trideoxy-beta-L-altropyranose hydrolase